MSNTAQSKAADRIAALLDDNSFVEIGSLVTARSTDFNLSDEKAPSDGVITGYGLIDDSLVYVYSQDASVLGGSIGEMHARKIARLYDLAMKMGAPVIGLLDSAGMRLQESTDALNAFGALYRKMALASGVIPQITAVLGNCGGGLAVAAGLSDFVFMEGSKAKLFVNSPNALAGNKEEDTASAQFQSEMSGLVDFVGTEEDILAQVRTLVSILPANNADEAPVTEAGDDLNRVCEGLEGAAGDTSILLSQISDGNLFCEVKAAAAKEMVTGFIKLNGTTVGAVANRTEVYNAEGEKEADFQPQLSAKGCEKAAKFVEFCDAFDIPVLTLTNATGFRADKHNEFRIAKAAAKLTAALAEATVPKVNVIVGKAFGSAYTIMNSQALGADLTFAWEDAQIGMMDAKLAAGIMYDGKDADTLAAKAAEYAQLQQSVTAAAERGYVDTVIKAEDTRKMVIGAFEMLYTKAEERPDKKHGTV
ncbi:MAG: carboxyl transferase [Lachnospiraceae bacterium]|nr:carboxyl transferase [Lachnospiraceae bacterium]